MFVAELLGALKIEFFGEPVNDHGKDEAHERTKPNLVARRHNEVERYWPFVIHEVLNRKVARGSGAANKRIAVERQCRFRCGQDAGEILVLLVEHFLDFLFHDGMRARRFARGKPPVMCVVFVVRVGEKLGESFAEGEAGSRKDAGEQAERSLPTFESGGIAHMQDHPRRDGRGGVLPVAFLRAVFPGADEHVRNVLGVGNIAIGEEANFRQRIKSRRVLRFHGRELETDLPSLAAETRGLGPILPLNVVDHGAFRPRQECRNDDAHALAAPCGSKREDVFRAVVPQVVEVLDGLFVPASDIHALLCLDEIGFLDIGFRGPPRRTVKVLGVFRERLCVREIQEKKEGAGGERPAHNDARADEQWKFDSNVRRASLRPHPDKPFIRCVEGERADAEPRRGRVRADTQSARQQTAWQRHSSRRAR